MRLAILKSSVASLMLSGLMAITGCSVSGQHTRHSMTPAGTLVADTSRDPSWTPPGEMDIAISDSTPFFQATKASADAMPQPNRQLIPKRQIRAATY